MIFVLPKLIEIIQYKGAMLRNEAAGLQTTVFNY